MPRDRQEEAVPQQNTTPHTGGEPRPNSGNIWMWAPLALAIIAAATELARLCCDLGLGRFSINWHQWEPGDKTGEEAGMLATVLGYLVAKNGALVDIVIDGDMF